MKNIVSFLLFAVAATVLTFAPAANAQCASGPTKFIKGAAQGGTRGFLAGLLGGGKNLGAAALNNAVTQGTANALSQDPNCDQQLNTPNAKAFRGNSYLAQNAGGSRTRNARAGYDGPVATASELNASAEKNSGFYVYVKSFNGGNPDILQSLLSEAFDANGYTVIPRDHPPDENKCMPGVLIVKVTATPNNSTNAWSYNNINTPGGNININNGGGTAKFFISVETSHCRIDGVWGDVPQLTRNRIPRTGTHREQSVNVSNTFGGTNANSGNGYQTYQVDPATDAARSALAELFNHQFTE